MKARLLIPLLTILCLFPAGAADSIGNTPWHLVDYWWDFGKDTEFESYEVNFNLSNDVDPKVRLYIAPIGLGISTRPPSMAASKPNLMVTASAPP